jgi:rhamnogalacturonan endolyase
MEISPNTDIWTDLVTNPQQYGSLPSKTAIENQVQVQDATWYYNVSEGNPYKEESYVTSVMPVYEQGAD